MNIPFLTSLFKKKSKSLTIPDSILIKKLKSITEFSELTLYKDITIYHHTKSYLIPLMLLDTRRGIYLFERKEWSYDDLKNSKIEKAENQIDIVVPDGIIPFRVTKENFKKDKRINIYESRFTIFIHSP